ncbi:MAG: hypothetical protein AAF662_02105 [Pseudomonadota bacterium]
MRKYRDFITWEFVNRDLTTRGIKEGGIKEGGIKEGGIKEDGDLIKDGAFSTCFFNSILVFDFV